MRNINTNKDLYHLNLLFKAPDGHEPKISTINGMLPNVEERSHEAIALKVGMSR